MKSTMTTIAICLLIILDLILLVPKKINQCSMLHVILLDMKQSKKGYLHEIK
jgi:hypothetical protein